MHGTAAGACVDLLLNLLGRWRVPRAEECGAVADNWFTVGVLEQSSHMPKRLIFMLTPVLSYCDVSCQNW